MEKIQISPSLVLKETRKPLRPLLIKHLVQKKKPVSVRPPEQPPEQWAVIPADQIIVPGAFCLNRPDDTTLEVLAPRYHIQTSFDCIFRSEEAHIRQKVEQRIQEFLGEGGVSRLLISLRSLKGGGVKYKNLEEGVKILAERVARGFFEKQHEFPGKKLSVSIAKIENGVLQDLVHRGQAPPLGNRLTDAAIKKVPAAQIFHLRDQVLAQAHSPRPEEGALSLISTPDDLLPDQNQSGIGPKRVVAPEERPTLNIQSGLLKQAVETLGDFAELVSRVSLRGKRRAKKQDHHGDSMGFEGIFFDRDSPARRQLFQQIHCHPYEPILVLQLYIEGGAGRPRCFTIVELPFNKPNSKHILQLCSALTQLEMLRAARFHPPGGRASAPEPKVSFRGSPLTQVLSTELQQKSTLITHLENVQDYELAREMLGFVWKVAERPYLGSGPSPELEMHKFLRPYHNSSFESKLRECFGEQYSQAKKALLQSRAGPADPRSQFSYLTHLMHDGITSAQQLQPFQMDSYKQRQPRPLRERPNASAERKRGILAQFTFQQPAGPQQPQQETSLPAPRSLNPMRRVVCKQRLVQSSIRPRPGQGEPQMKSVAHSFQQGSRPVSQPRRLELDTSDIKLPATSPSKSMTRFQGIQSIYCQVGKKWPLGRVKSQQGTGAGAGERYLSASRPVPVQRLK